MMKNKGLPRALLIAVSWGALALGASSCASTSTGATPKGNDVWSLLARGEGEKARRYFTGEVDVNAADSEGRTPLHLAAENEDADLAAFFIALGARVDTEDGQGRTALDISAAKRDAATARVLVAAQADIHHPTPGGGSPALEGIRENGPYFLSLISPATLASVDGTGKNLFHLAAEEGSAPALTTLVEEARRLGGTGQPDLAVKDGAGRNPLDIALSHTASREHAAAAEYLILAGAASNLPLYDYFAPAVRLPNYNLRSADGMSPLHYMARESCTGYIAFMLDKGADVNIKNASGATPLHEAARSGSLEVMSLLIDRGADVNAQDAKGNSILHIAVPLPTAEAALKLFLSRGASPNLRDEHGDSPLHVAVMLNRPASFVETLLASRADGSIRNKDGKTPLFLAVEDKRLALIPPLLSARSDIFATDNDGYTPYDIALREGGAVLYTLLTEDTVLASDSEGNTVLHVAISERKATADLVRYILERQALVNARNKAGDSALHLAVRLNDEIAGTVLLEGGADIFATNALGESPLYLAFPRNGSRETDVRRWMLTARTLTARDGLGNTALHYLAQWQTDQWIPLAVRMGASTEAVNATGETPLFTAVKQDAPGTIKTLAAECGANLEARDTLNNTPLHVAVQWNALKAVNALLAQGADINAHALNGKTPLHEAVRLGHKDIEAQLLAGGADIEAWDSDGNTPFFEAVTVGSAEALERLLAKGADINRRNFSGDTALHLAVRENRKDLVDILIDNDASIHALNSRDRTPYQDALTAYPGLVPDLLAGDRITRPDDRGQTPLHIAIAERCPPSTIENIIDLGQERAPNTRWAAAIDAAGRTPLRLAVDMNNWEVAQILVKEGSNPFLTGADGKSPAMIALSRGTDALAALFSGENVNTRDDSGNTILHYAAQADNTRAIDLLIELGADKGAKNLINESPADIARARGYAAAEGRLK